METSEQNSHQFIHTSFVSMDFGKNMSDSCAAFDVQIEGQLLLCNFIAYLQQDDILGKEQQNRSMLKMTG